MRLVGDVSQEHLVEKDGAYQHDIVEVGPRDVRVVHDVHLTFRGLNTFPPQVGEGVPQPDRERAYVYRDLLCLPHRPPPGSSIAQLWSALSLMFGETADFLRETPIS